MALDDDHELLTRVGPGTAMGALFRQYWLPLLKTSELPTPDGAPKRVRILGENLIAFRASSGRVGLIANHCPHRGASLFFGRNEEEGLRCVYHGWKFDVDGRCVDMPNEPPDSTFKDRIRTVAYPCHEEGGAIWVYMGPRHEHPPLPELEWIGLPKGHCVIGKTWRECNWAQAMEGDIDNAHVGFLHNRLDARNQDTLASQIMYTRKAPHIEVVDTPYGAMYGSRRDADEHHYNWRVIQFLFPSFSMVTTGSPQDRGTVPSHMWIPIDDENVMQWGIRWNPTEPLAAGVKPISESEEYLPNSTGWLGQWRPAANKTNDYLIDYEAQRHERFSGIGTVPLQDKAVTESMGPITNRAAEHLGSTDAMIIRVRRRLVDAAKALRDRGTPPPGVDAPSIYRVRSVIVNLPKEIDWVEGTRDVVRAFSGLPAASVV